MTENGSVGEKLRKVRDKGRPPHEVWQFRHGHTLLGYTFHAQAPGSFETFTFDDLTRFLLIAAEDPAATDLQLHFHEPSGDLGADSVSSKLEDLLSALVREKFAPLSVVAKMRDDGTGWIRFSLFAPGDLPEMPFPETPPLVGHA